MNLDSKIIDVTYNLSTQSVMVKTTKKSDLPWFAIFSEIIHYILSFQLLSISKTERPKTFSHCILCQPQLNLHMVYSLRFDTIQIDLWAACQVFSLHH